MPITLPWTKSYHTLTETYPTFSIIVTLPSSRVTPPLTLWLPYLCLTRDHVTLPSLTGLTLP